MRVGLLPTPGDPLVCDYWLRNYERVWRDEIDELHVLVNGSAPGEAAEMFRRAGASVVEANERIGHGQALSVLLDSCPNADEVVLLEDDAYVRMPGVIAMTLEHLQEWNAVFGTPRGGMSPQVEQAALERWGEVWSSDGSGGHGLWPCFLFARHSALQQVSHEGGFHSRSWLTGDTIPGLNYTPTEEVTTDTFTLAAFLLRGRFPIKVVPQYKELFQKSYRACEYTPPWFHAGGLSNWENLEEQPGDIGGTNGGLDWAHRLWWWFRTAEKSDLPGRTSRMMQCLSAVDRLGVEEEFEKWENTLLPWINWDDAA